MTAKSKAAQPSICEQGGPENQVTGIRVRVADVVTFAAWICGTAARMHVVLQDAAGVEQKLIDQEGLTKGSATLPRLAPGLYILLWSFTQVSSPWQTRTEVAVNDTNRFLHRKSSTDNNPFLRGFLSVEVVP